MNTPDTPTPRTTEQVFSYPIMVEISDGDWEERQGLAVPADFARQLERELTAAKEELARVKQNHGCARNQGSTQFCAEAVARDAQLALLRKRVEAADGLAEAAGCVVNRDAEYDRDKWVKDGAGWDSDMIELKHADAAYRATEGKK